MVPYPSRSGLTLLVLSAATLALTGCTTAGPLQDHLPEGDISAADTAFILVCSAMVMLMTPALALFYAGLVRSKNVLSVVMHSMLSLALITIIWNFAGYSLAFGPSSVMVGEYGIFGSLDWAFRNNQKIGMDPHPVYCPTIPHRLFMIFQCMFAAITPAIISGAFAERMKFKTYLVFISLWSLIVYCPVAHWVWSEHGMLKKLGSLDFAGGNVVHMSSGLTALVVAIMIKPRRGFPREAFIPHNLMLTLLGAGLLWFGWFGFNAGSALGSGKIATVAFVATQMAAAAGAFSWAMYDWITRGKPTLLGAVSGALAGLVAITPASGFVSPNSAIIIGLTAGVVCAWAVTWRARRGIDDALDAFGLHGVGGALGALATGVFASTYLNAAAGEKGGLINGGVDLMLAQIYSVIITAVYVVVVSWILLKILDLTMGLRVSPEDEQMGLDVTQHGEAAYSS